MRPFPPKEKRRDMNLKILSVVIIVKNFLPATTNRFLHLFFFFYIFNNFNVCFFLFRAVGKLLPHGTIGIIILYYYFSGLARGKRQKKRRIDGTEAKKDPLSAVTEGGSVKIGIR